MPIVQQIPNVEHRLEVLRESLAQCRLESEQLFHPTQHFSDQQSIPQRSDECQSPTKTTKSIADSTTNTFRPSTMRISEEDDILALEQQWHDLMEDCMNSK